MIVKATAAFLFLIALPMSANAAINIDLKSDEKLVEVSNSGNKINGNQEMLVAKDNATKEIITLRESNRIWAVTAMCLISVASLIIVIIALHKMKGSPSDIVSASGLNFIVFGTIILVTVADTEQQLTAAIGVLGAIAGYLFGSLKEKAVHAHTSPDIRPHGDKK